MKDQVEQVNRDKIWAERISNLQKAIKDLNQEWLTKERQLGTLFKNIEEKYMLKLDEKEKMIADAQKTLKSKDEEYQVLAMTLSDKARQLAQTQQQLQQLQSKKK